MQRIFPVHNAIAITAISTGRPGPPPATY